LSPELLTWCPTKISFPIHSFSCAHESLGVVDMNSGCMVRSLIVRGMYLWHILQVYCLFRGCPLRWITLMGVGRPWIGPGLCNMVPPPRVCTLGHTVQEVHCESTTSLFLRSRKGKGGWRCSCREVYRGTAVKGAQKDHVMLKKEIV
jgi:hypothetical protein